MHVMRLAATMLMSIMSLVAAAQEQRAETSQGLAALHETAPTMPWIPYPSRAELQSGHCGAWERDGFESIQVNVDAFGCNIVGDAANEPSIAISYTDPRKIVIGWRQFDSPISSDFRQAGYGYSHDGGSVWVFPGSLTPGVSGGDPVLAADTAGTFFYLSTSFDELRMFRSINGGLSWLAPQQVAEGYFTRRWMAIDQSASNGRNNIYISSYWGGLFRSVDGGESFYYFPTEAGETIATGPDGAVYLASGNNLAGDDYAWVNKSLDVMNPGITMPTFIGWFLRAGANYGGSESPNAEGLAAQAWVAVDHSAGESRGDVYVVTMTGVDPLESDPGDIVFVRGEDGGAKWSRPIAINDDFPGPDNWQWFPAMSVAPNGRIDVVWNDTRNSQQANLSELFYSYSNDAGRTWSRNIPVSPMFNSWVGWPLGNHSLGDHYITVSDNLGVNVAYAATFNGEQDIYFLRIGPWDCNGNEVDDAVDISSEDSSDCNGNEVPDECEYRVDIDGDGLTTIEDFTALAASMSDPTIAPLLTKEGAGGGPSSTRYAEADPPQSPLGKGGGTDSSASLQLDTEPLSYEATEGVKGGPPVAGTSSSDCSDLYDANHDGDIDLADFAYLQRVFVAE